MVVFCPLDQVLPENHLLFLINLLIVQLVVQANNKEITSVQWNHQFDSFTARRTCNAGSFFTGCPPYVFVGVCVIVGQLYDWLIELGMTPLSLAAYFEDFLPSQFTLTYVFHNQCCIYWWLSEGPNRNYSTFNMIWVIPSIWSTRASLTYIWNINIP